MTNREKTPTPQGAPVRYTLWQLVLYFLKLGAMGFGGPVALVGYMRRDLVQQRSWITEADYKEGLALAQLAPGPMAAQTAIYLAMSTTESWAQPWRVLLLCCRRFHGGSAGLGLQPIWRAVLDAGGVLWGRCGGHWHHCHQCAQAHNQEHW